MISASILTTLLTIITILFVVGVVAYRLLWAGSNFAGYFAGARWLPRTLQRVQHWLRGERP
jgi:hypothetical protein